MHWLNHQYWFNEGANYWQWITSFIAIGGWSTVLWHLWHNRCFYCYIRQGQVPIEGTVHKACKKHATENGHMH